MILEDLTEKLKTVQVDNTFLYFVTRVLKPDTSKKSKLMEKYDYKVYQIDVNDEIRSHLYKLTEEQLEGLVKKKMDLQEYEVICDDTDQLLTYSMSNKTMAFADVVNNQLKNTPPKIVSLEEIISGEELWAYSVGFFLGVNDWIYTFRKILSSKVAVDEKESNRRGKLNKTIRTIFNSKSQKLELIEGETVSLDKQVDCIFYQDTFYVAKKPQFEQIVGLSEEFKTIATGVVADLEATQMFDGISVLAQCVESNPSLHKKMVRLQKIGNYRNLTEEVIAEMTKVCSAREGKQLKVKAGKLLIEDEKDIDLLLKMFCDYYKVGEVSGKPYGTFAGRHILVPTA